MHQTHKVTPVTPFEVTDAFLAEVKDALPEKVYLLYIDRSDRLGLSDIAAIMRGDFAEVDEAIWENFGDARWNNANEEVKDAILQVLKRDYEEDFYGEFDDIAEDILLFEHGDTLRQYVWDADASTPLEDLIRNTPTSYRDHIRVRFGGDDPTPFRDYMNEQGEVNLDRLCTDLGITASPGNIKTLSSILVELDPEDWYSPFLVANVDLQTLYQLHLEHGAAFGTDEERAAVTAKVTIEDPFLFLTNPYMGNGFGEVIEGQFIVNLKDIRHDREAIGYSADEVFGGISLAESEIALVAEG